MSIEDDIMDEYYALSDAEQTAVARSESSLARWVKKVLKWLGENIKVEDIIYVIRRVWETVRGT